MYNSDYEFIYSISGIEFLLFLCGDDAFYILYFYNILNLQIKHYQYRHFNYCYN